MSHRDFRCLYSGVSLLGAETMLILTAQAQGSQTYDPIALPLWGHYEGMGTLSDVSDGPNAELILESLQKAELSGELQIDFEKLGIAPCPLDHIETFLALLAANQIHQSGAVSLSGYQLSFCLFEANVAAALMLDEPARLHSTDVDELAEAVLAHPLSAHLYGPLRRLGPSVRCKFGLSFVSLASLIDHFSAEKLQFAGPGEGLFPEPGDAAKFLAEAYARFSENDALIEALSEYATLDEVENVQDDADLGK